MQFYAHVQRIWQSPFVINNPQTGNGAGVWMMSCPEEMVLRIWGFWKDVSWDWTIEGELDSTVERCSWVFQISTGRDLKHYKMCCTLGWGQHSIDFLRIVSLSTCHHGPKSGINKTVRIWNKRVRLCLHMYMYCITVVIDLITVYSTSLQKGKNSPNEWPGYHTKQSDGEVLVMLELWGMWSTPSLLSFSGPRWPRVVAPDRVLSMG